ncbi:MAG: IgGFc-binding protein, partial [Tannerellaceae bacterium]|nr:IgGFc-binding protein [Tannerellaceae bacterium]
MQLSPAGTPIVRTLNKGETLKIMEYSQDEMPSLAGTLITSDDPNKPIAVTVTEDLVHGDTSGDQIVPVGSLGTRYIVPRGYLDGRGKAGLVERFYLVATVPGTTVNVYTATGTSSQISLSAAGDAARYTFPSGLYAVYVKSNYPVYVYQRTGYLEEGAALLPSLYAIGQKQLSFYNTGADMQAGALVFRKGAQSDFTISYGSTTAALSGSTYSVPNEPDWMVTRFNFPSAANGKIVTIRNTQSPFSLGYVSSATGGNTPYGYFSAYSFELPDTTYMCTVNPSVTLEVGYAMTYEWIFNGSVISTERTVTVTQEGEYTLVMNQDPT